MNVLLETIISVLIGFSAKGLPLCIRATSSDYFCKSLPTKPIIDYERLIEAVISQQNLPTFEASQNEQRMFTAQPLLLTLPNLPTVFAVILFCYFVLVSLCDLILFCGYELNNDVCICIFQLTINELDNSKLKQRKYMTLKVISINRSIILKVDYSINRL